MVKKIKNKSDIRDNTKPSDKLKKDIEDKALDVKQEPDKEEEKQIVIPDTDELDEGNAIKFDTPEEEQELTNDLCDKIRKTIDSESGLRNELVNFHSDYELEPSYSSEKESSHFELKDSPGMKSIWGAVHTKGKISRYMLSMFGSNTIIIINLVDREKKGLERRLNKWANFYMRKVVQIKSRARALFFNVGIENTGITSLSLEVKYEPDTKIEEYDTIEQFKEDFPDAKSAGIEKEDYKDFVNVFKNRKAYRGANPLPPVKIKTKTINISRVYPMVEVINREDFGLIPADSRWETKQGAFQKIGMRWDDIAKRFAQGKYRNLDLLYKRASGSETVPGTEGVKNKQDQLAGTTKDSGKSKYNEINYDVFKVLYNIDIDKDGLEEECIFTVAYREKVMLRSEYRVKQWYLTPHYIEKRTNRFDGIGVMKKVSSVTEEGNEIINLRMKIGEMVTSPSFKAKKSSNFDPQVQYWYPGVIWWLDNMDDVEQWQIGANFPELYQEESLLERKAEMLSGYTSGMSGKELSQDPNAPGNKTMALIGESNILINEDIDVLREGMEEVIYNAIDMCSEYLPEDDKYLKMFGLKKEDLKIAREEIELKGVSIANNPDTTKAEADAFIGKAIVLPQIQSDPRAVNQLTRDWVEAWGRDSDSLVRTMEELRLEQIQIQQEALRRMIAEMKTKAEETAFIQQMVAEGFTPKEAAGLLKEFRQAEALDKQGQTGPENAGQEAPATTGETGGQNAGI